MLKLWNIIKFRLLGSITLETVRPQLKTAIKSKDKKVLEAAIKESISAGLPGLEADIQEAREALYKMEGHKGG